jgi:hypothetical protein
MFDGLFGSSPSAGTSTVAPSAPDFSNVFSSERAAIKTAPIAKANEQSLLQQELQRNTQTKQPQPKPQSNMQKAGSIFKPIGNFFKPAAAPLEFLRAGAGAATGNMKAEGAALKRGGQDVGVGVQNAQGVARSVPEATTSIKQMFTGKPASYQPNKATSLLFGKTPVQSIQTEAKGAQTSHPGGFHIPGTPINLTPKETGFAEGAAKVAQDIPVGGAVVKGVAKGIKGAVKGSIVAAGKDQAVNDLTRNVATNKLATAGKESTSIPTEQAAMKPPILESKTVTPKPAANEAGFVDPGAAVKDIQAMIDKHQQVTKASGDISKDLEINTGMQKDIKQDAASVLKNRAPISNEDKQVLQNYRDSKAAGLKPAELPAHLQAEDAHVTALNKAAQAADAEKARLEGNEAKAQSIEARNPEIYTHKIAQGKGSSVDYLLQGNRDNPLSVSGLGKTTSGSKQQMFHAVTDEEGNRRVVAVKSQTLKDDLGRKITQSHQVTALADSGNVSEKLGTLKLVSNEDRMNKEVKPFQNKLSNLKKEYRALQSVKIRGGVSEARVNALAQKVALLQDKESSNVYEGSLKGILKGGEIQRLKSQLRDLKNEHASLSSVRINDGASEARINALAHKVSLLQDKEISQGLTKSERRSIQQATLKAKELIRVKAPSSNVDSKLEGINREIINIENVIKNTKGERTLDNPTGGLTAKERQIIHDATLRAKELMRVKAPSTNAPRKIEGIGREIINIENSIKNIEKGYDPEALDQKTFIGKDGKKYTIGQATQDEITKASGQKYYVDPKLTSVINYADSRTALENTRFIEKTKATLENKNLAIKEGETAPKNFKSTSNNYFRGYKFDPKVAEVLDDAAYKPKDGADLLNRIGRTAKQTIVYLPLKHDLNEAAFYAIDRGLTNWVNPLALGRMSVALGKATRDVIKQEGVYKQMLRAGAHVMTADDKELGKVVSKQLKSAAGNQDLIMRVAKSIGSSPARVYSAMQKVTVWDVQDILNVARVRENMMSGPLKKGMNFEDALKQTERYGLQYKVPSRAALPGKLGRSVSKTLQSPKVFFGPYTYDKYRVTSNIAKDIVNPKSLIKSPGQNARAIDKAAAMALGAALAWPLVEKGVQNVTGDKAAHVTAPGPLSLPQTLIKVARGQENPVTAATNQISLGTPLKTGLDLFNNRDSFSGKLIRDPNAPLPTEAKQAGSYLASQISPVQKSGASKNATQNKGLSTFLSLAGASLPKNTPEATKLYSLQYDSLPMITTQAKAQAKAGDFKGAAATIDQYNAQVVAAAKADAQSKGQPAPTMASLKNAHLLYEPKQTTIHNWASGKKVKAGAFAP